MTNTPAMRRDPSRGMIAGVCVALARRWNVDPLLVRVGFVLATLFTHGLGLLAYALLWALLPARQGGAERGRFSTTVVLLVAGAVVISGLVLNPPGLLASALVVGLVALAMSGGRRWRGVPAERPVARPEPRTEFERLSRLWDERLADVDAGRPTASYPSQYFAQADPVGLYAPQPADSERRRVARHELGRRTWLGVLLAWGIVGAGLGVASLYVAVPVVVWVAAALLVVAVALILTSRPRRAAFGRPPAMLFVGTLLAVATIALVTPTAPPFRDSLPVTRYPYNRVAELPGDLDLGTSSAVVDLSRLHVAESTETSITMDAGRLVLDLPDKANYTVDYQIDGGSVSDSQGTRSGLDLSGSLHSASTGEPTLTITVKLGLGSLELR